MGGCISVAEEMRLREETRLHPGHGRFALSESIGSAPRQTRRARAIRTAYRDP
jgi:hypothetical protein